MSNDKNLSSDHAPGGRPYFGATPTPKRSVERCVDCGTTDGLTYYPIDDVHSCRPCANGENDMSLGDAVREAGEWLGELLKDYTPPKIEDRMRKAWGV